MTPAKRRRLIKSITVMTIALSAAFLGRFFFLNQSVPSLLLGRKPGAAAPGTVLIKETPAAQTSQVSTNSPKPTLNKVSASSPSEPSVAVKPATSAETSETPLKTKFDLLTTWIYDEKKPAIPDEVKALDGKLIEITGFMLPVNETENITKFILVNSLWGCCFGQSPAVNHVIVVSMEAGKTVDFYPDPVKVTGRFSVGETREEGFLVSVFRMDGQKVVVR